MIHKKMMQSNATYTRRTGVTTLLPRVALVCSARTGPPVITIAIITWLANCTSGAVSPVRVNAGSKVVDAGKAGVTVRKISAGTMYYNNNDKNKSKRLI
jgi:hypothetical protein